MVIIRKLPLLPVVTDFDPIIGLRKKKRGKTEKRFSGQLENR
jgi:hypothetical protein